MERKGVVVEYQEADNLWRIYWRGTRELADERWFPTLEAAGVAARAIVFPVEDRPEIT